MIDRTDEQNMLADQIRGVLAGRSSPDRLRSLIDSGAEWDEALWRTLAGLGFIGAGISEADGGLGMSVADLGVISQELGRANASVPFFSSIVLAAQAISTAGSPEQRQRWLPRIASGEIIATVAYSEPSCRFDGCLLTGHASPVADGGIADIAVVVTMHQGTSALALVELDGAGVERSKLDSFDQLRAHYAFTFDAAAAEPLAAAPVDDVVSALFDHAAIQAAFEGVGGAEACLEMARTYALERRIFGRPLASYQAIKHKLADVLVGIELARSNTYRAAASADWDRPLYAAAARLSAVSAFERAARDNLHVHGGIGYTFEANPHFYYRRERTLALSLGDRALWADRLLASVNGSITSAIDVAPEDEATATFRQAARRWLADNAPAFELPASGHIPDREEFALGKAWQAAKAVAGYAGILTPDEEGGRGGSMAEAVAWSEEEARYRVPTGPYIGIGLGMAMPVIAKYGDDAQKRRFLAPTLTGELTWCQLFSEPGAGSDLAAVRARAIRDESGDWIVNGQKVWSSWAHLADWGILLVRTDPSVPKHKGLTFFVIDMRSPGIDVRPIRQISGMSDFNETFMTDVRVPDACRIGPIGGGWAAAMTVLTGERLAQGAAGDGGDVGSLIHYARETARGAGTALDDGAVRMVLATAWADESGERVLYARLREQVSRGESPGATASIVKLAYASRYQRMSGFAMEIRGLAGLAPPKGDDTTRTIQHDYIWSTALRIAGGADEVLRNQLAERVLGMPGEIRGDKDIPFSALI